MTTLTRPEPALTSPPPDLDRYRAQGARRALARDGVQVLGVTGLLLPVAVWLAGGGAAGFATLAGAVKAVGIVSGLIATAAMVGMLWLTARVPFLDRALGQDRATALHASLGQITFGGLIAHGLFTVSGYALADRTGPVAEFLSLWQVGDFVLAVVAILLLTAVSISSVVAVKKSLPFEAWKVIHLLTYAAVLAALPHQFTMGGVFADGASFWFWAIVWGATLFVMLAYRFFRPLFNSLDHRLVVSAVEPVGADTVSITMTGRRLDQLGTLAGQYFHWRFLAPGLWWHQHPFSISAQPTGSTLRVTVRALGRGTRQLQRVRPGTPVLFEGPYGMFSDAARTAPDAVFVGIGIGIAPIRAVLEETSFAPGRATVILRSSRPEELYLANEIEALCRAKGARLYLLTGHRGRDAEGATTWLPAQHAGVRLADLADLSRADVFVCGPDAAADLVVADARAAGVPDERLHHERFAW